jgi:hypothetical protein
VAFWVFIGGMVVGMVIATVTLFFCLPPEKVPEPWTKFPPAPPEQIDATQARKE